MEKSKRASLMQKFTILFFILILPFNIIGIAVSVFSYHNSIRNVKSAIEYTLDSNASLVGTEIYNTNIMFYNLLHTNTYFLNMYRTDDDNQYQIIRYQLFNDMNDQIRVANIADSFFIYNVSRDDYLQMPGYTASTAGTRPYMEYIEHFEDYNSQWFLTDDHTKLIRILYSSSLNTYYGAVIELEDFLLQLKSLEGFDTITYTFSSEPAVSQSQYIGFSQEITDNIYLLASVSKNELNNTASLQLLIILFFIMCLALIPVLILLMRHYVNHPLKQLNAAHHQLQQGHEDYRITTPSNSLEFDDAYASFNTMAGAIQELHGEILEKELSNKQLQIDFLQLQIRPHFLLNSFNVLYTLIQNGEKASAQDMILFLSDYFRYLFRSGRELQLFSKERKLIEDYMRISKISYPSSFEVSWQIDPIIDLMRVPPLLLHSFMENIIAHALLPTRIIHIVFSGEYNDGLVTFYISDDGKGIDAEDVRQINHINNNTPNTGKHVGIKNSISRLKYYYGDQANVECDSQLNVGTTFIITIPYNLEEE